MAPILWLPMFILTILVAMMITASISSRPHTHPNKQILTSGNTRYSWLW